MSPQLTLPGVEQSLPTIALYRPKDHGNIGGVLRTAHLMGIEEVIAIDPAKPYKRHAADTTNATKHIDYTEMDMYSLLLIAEHRDQEIVTVLPDGLHNLATFEHPDQCVYLFGNETNGLDKWARAMASELGPSVYIPTRNHYSLNLATSASIVMYDRHVKGAPSE